MKRFAVVLLCIFAAVQGRSTGPQAPTAAALGENPWVVHNRVAVSTSGFLNSCVGSLVNDRWVLTSANCVTNVRFVWLRYGAVDVIQPELVTETSTALLHPNFNQATGDNDIALVSINRSVQSTANVAPVALAGADDEIPSLATLCGYGSKDEGPGETLSCANVEVEQADDGNLKASTEATKFDIGAPLVKDGVQYGVLSSSNEDGETVFINIKPYVEWIRSVAGIATPNSDDVPGSAVEFVY